MNVYGSVLGGSGGGSVEYSTTEKAVGKWINGSTLYQRTFTGTTSSSSNETNVASLSGSYVVRSFEGAFKQESSGCEVPIIYSQVTDSNDWMNCYHYGGYITLSYGSNNRSKEYWVTIRYTK